MSETKAKHGYACESCDEHLGGIIGIVEHLTECDPVRLSAESLSRKERNTLLYIESRLVDHAGKLAGSQMNYEDRQNLKVFRAAGLLEVSDPMPEPGNAKENTQQVESFTDEAFDLVRDCRQLRVVNDERVDFPVGGRFESRE